MQMHVIGDKSFIFVCKSHISSVSMSFVYMQVWSYLDL